MARQYKGNLALTNGATIDFLGPFDNRGVVASVAQLTAEDTWLSGGNYYVYPGMPVATSDTGNIYVYRGRVNSTDFTSMNNWVKLPTSAEVDTAVAGITGVFNYKKSIASFTIDAFLAKGETEYKVKKGDVFNVASEFTHSQQKYPAGTNIVALHDQTVSDKGNADDNTAFLDGTFDPLGGTTQGLVTDDELTAKGYQTAAQVGTAIDIALAGFDTLSDTDKNKLALISDNSVQTTADDNPFDFDILNLQTDSLIYGNQIVSVFNQLHIIYTETKPSLNFVTAGGVKVKIEVISEVESGSSTNITFCFFRKGKYYEGVLTRTNVGSLSHPIYNYDPVVWLTFMGSEGVGVKDILSHYDAYAESVVSIQQQLATVNNNYQTVNHRTTWYKLS